MIYLLLLSVTTNFCLLSVELASLVYVCVNYVVIFSAVFLKYLRILVDM